MGWLKGMENTALEERHEKRKETNEINLILPAERSADMLAVFWVQDPCGITGRFEGGMEN